VRVRVRVLMLVLVLVLVLLLVPVEQRSCSELWSVCALQQLYWEWMVGRLKLPLPNSRHLPSLL
jgi:hypothetical protein